LIAPEHRLHLNGETSAFLYFIDTHHHHVIKSICRKLAFSAKGAVHPNNIHIGEHENRKNRQTYGLLGGTFSWNIQLDLIKVVLGVEGSGRVTWNEIEMHALRREA